MLITTSTPPANDVIAGDDRQISVPEDLAHFMPDRMEMLSDLSKFLLGKS